MYGDVPRANSRQHISWDTNPSQLRGIGDILYLIRAGYNPPELCGEGLSGTTSASGATGQPGIRGREGGSGCGDKGRGSRHGIDGGTFEGYGGLSREAIGNRYKGGGEMRKGKDENLSADALSGEDIAKILREMAARVQRNLEDNQGVTTQLESLAERLERERNA